MWPVGVCSSLWSESTPRARPCWPPRARQAKDQPSRPAPAERPRRDRAQDGGHETLEDRTRYRDPPHREQFVDMKMQPDAEHDEDDTDLGKLFGQILIGMEARRVLADNNPGKEITDDGREPEPMVRKPRNKRRGESTR